MSCISSRNSCICSSVAPSNRWKKHLSWQVFRKGYSTIYARKEMKENFLYSTIIIVFYRILLNCISSYYVLEFLAPLYHFARWRLCYCYIHDSSCLRPFYNFINISQFVTFHLAYAKIRVIWRHPLYCYHTDRTSFGPIRMNKKPNTNTSPARFPALFSSFKGFQKHLSLKRLLNPVIELIKSR